MAHIYNASTGRLRQENCKFKANPSHIMRLFQKTNKKKGLGSLGEERLMTPSKEWEEGLVAPS